MPALINPKITDAGLAAAINANANGLQLAITHVALGTGKYDPEVTGAGMTAMAARKETVAIGGGQVAGTGGFKLTCRFDSWTGTPNPYDATELGFWAGDPNAGGVLFAVHSHPSQVLVQRNSLDYIGTFGLQLTRAPTGSITIVIDPDEAAALGLIFDHEGKANPHSQYVLKAGDTMTGPLLGVTAPQGDVSKKKVTSEFVDRVGQNYPASGGIALTTAANVLALTDIGRWADIQANASTTRLPKAATAKIGATFQISCSVANATLIPTDDDTFVFPGGSASVFPVVFGESLTITRNAAKEWRVVNIGSRLPAGQVSYFAGNVAPSGWLKLNGVTLSRAAYPALWAYAVSTGGVVSDTDWQNGMSGRFSSGVAGSDFRIPDLRGVFLRALDDGRGIDSGRVWGSYQDHANRSHAHGVNDPGHAHPITDPGHGHPTSDPGHVHSGWTDAQGQHVHGVYPGVDGGFIYGGNAGIGNNGTAQGVPPFGNGFGNKLSNVAETGAAGSHAHNVGIGLNGTGFTVGPAGSNLAIQARATGISIAADGSEARPRNIAWSLFIKY